MKLRFIYFLFIAGLLSLVLQSRSSGAAAVLGQDRTGSPLSSGTCSACHGGSSSSMTTVISLKNAQGNAVSSYMAGQSYTLEVAITGSSAGKYATQAVVLDASNAGKGTMGTPTSSNTKVTTLSGRQYLEHSSLQSATNGSYSVPWTAPSSGSGTLSIYAVGMASNGNSGTSGDPVKTATLTLTESVGTSISYPSNGVYCAGSVSTVTPVITGTTGGIFSSSSTLVTVNTSTGVVDIANAALDTTVTITYTYTGGTQTATIRVNSLADASFSYANSTYCTSRNKTPLPTKATQGGQFSATPAGLNLNTTTGLIRPVTSTPAVYQVRYIAGTTCPDTTVQTITILKQDTVNISYNSASYCIAAADPSPVLTGQTGGKYSSTTGLVIDSITGQIDVSASTIGNYTVTYATAGLCSDNATVSVQITGIDLLTITYPKAVFCTSDSDPIATTTGGINGRFSAGTGLAIDSITGALNIAASDTGFYVVTYATSGVCGNSKSTGVTIKPQDDATVTYADSTYCIDSLVTDIPVANNIAGVFTSTTAVVDSSTGLVDLLQSGTGSHVIVYQTLGTCSATSSTRLQVDSCVLATAYFAKVSYLNTYPNPVVDQLNIQSDLTIDKVEAYSITGALVHRIEAAATTTLSLSVSTWPKGIYLLRIRFEDGSITNQKVYKQ